jgi:two-component system LytT family response regulator
MNLKCAIVDDEPLALGLLESYVNKTPFLELVGKYSSAVQAIKELPEKHIDLLFLDIQMPELNGLEFSKMVDSGTRIVFTTAFDQYAIDGYKVNALDYLLKPISYVDFLQAANKAVQWFELLQQPKEEIQSIFVKSEYKLVHRGAERLSQNLRGGFSQAYPVSHEHEGNGGTSACLAFHARPPFLHCSEE